MSYTNHSLFKQDQVARRPSTADLQALSQQIEKNIIRPLKTLNDHRPGNPNTESALEITMALDDVLKKTALQTEAHLKENKSEDQSEENTASNAPQP